MVSNLNLSRNTIRIIRFGLSFVLFMYFDWDSFEDHAVRLIVGAAIISLLMVFMTEVTDNLDKEGHVIYSSLNLKTEIIRKVESLGFTLKSSAENKSIYSSSSRWNAQYINLITTDYSFKIEVPKHLVDHFEDYVR